MVPFVIYTACHLTLTSYNIFILLNSVIKFYSVIVPNKWLVDVPLS